MITKIIHTADWHLKGKKEFDVFKKHMLDFTLQCKSMISDSESWRIVIVGDLFHDKYLTLESYQIMQETLLELSKLCPLIITIGNHDFDESNPQKGDCISPVVDFLKKVGVKNITYLKESQIYEDNNIVFAHYSDFDNGLDVNEVRKHQEKTVIGLHHSPLVGSQSFGYLFDKGRSLDMFDGCDMVMLGDIHLRQQMDASIPIVYCGSLYQQHIGESINNHGYVLWDIQTKSFEFKNIKNQRPILKIEVSKDFKGHTVKNI